MSSERRHEVLAHVLLLAVVAVWGATFGVVRNALRDCSPLLFNLLRMTMAFAALALLHRRAWRTMTRSTVAAGAMAGFFLAMGYALQTAGLVTTTAARSAFLTGLVVVLVPIFMLFPVLRPKQTAGDEVRPPIRRTDSLDVRREQPADATGEQPVTVRGMQSAMWARALPFAGAAGAFLGIVLLTTPAALPLTEFTRGFNMGDVLSFLCAIAFAGHLLSLAHLAKRVPTSHLATLQIGFAALFLAMATPVVEHPQVHWTGRLIASLLLCSLIATAAAFSVQSWAQKHLAASHTALLLALEPAFALLTGLLFFGETLTMRGAIGAGIILVSLIGSDLLAAQPVSEQPEANTV